MMEKPFSLLVFGLEKEREFYLWQDFGNEPDVTKAD